MLPDRSLLKEQKLLENPRIKKNSVTRHVTKGQKSVENARIKIFQMRHLLFRYFEKPFSETSAKYFRNFGKLLIYFPKLYSMGDYNGKEDDMPLSQIVAFPENDVVDILFQ